MRKDAIGFFWEDLPPEPKQKVEKVKRQPPEPVWLNPDYLPGLEEAKRFNVPLYSDMELAAAAGRERLVYDIEVYPNYFLVAFMGISSGKIVYFEFTENDNHTMDHPKLRWVVDNFTLVGFNSNNFDAPILALALAGHSTRTIKEAADRIIFENERPWQLLRSHKVKQLQMDHIDLIEVAPLKASLKTYGGRLHCRRLQDLPFHPAAELSQDQIDIVRWYCVNDLQTTAALHEALKKELELRETLSREYRMDLRSRSDAQIAEAVIGEEISVLNGVKPERPYVEPGTTYRYQVPRFLKFDSAVMNWTLERIRNTKFVVSEFGNIGMPKELADLKINIGQATYRLGIGGLHSSEKATAHVADANTIIVDRDVTSYYPYIILNLGLYPQHLGVNFLRVYQQLVQRRLEAKRTGDKVTADTLKITINGSYGKLGSRHSVLYSPHLLIQVTITGQLSLLMLIERLELRGIPVISANTDGVVIKCPRARYAEMEWVVKQWEQDTGFETEENEYRALYSRDVNSYIAVKADGTTKLKGAYTRGGLRNNPTNEVCIEAVEKLLTTGMPIDHTIKACRDLNMFVSVRNVKGGAVKDGEYLGRVVRWYYSAEERERGSEIVYASNGNKVPRSDGAKPLMLLPDQFPNDVDYEWYIEEANSILRAIGYLKETA